MVNKQIENNVYEEAKRALRISTILTYLNRQWISVEGCLEMPLEVLETHLLEVMKPKRKKRNTEGLFGRIRKFFS